MTRGRVFLAAPFAETLGRNVLFVICCAMRYRHDEVNTSGTVTRDIRSEGGRKLVVPVRSSLISSNVESQPRNSAFGGLVRACDLIVLIAISHCHPLLFTEVLPPEIDTLGTHTTAPEYGSMKSVLCRKRVLQVEQHQLKLN